VPLVTSSKQSLKIVYLFLVIKYLEEFSTLFLDLEFVKQAEWLNVIMSDDLLDPNSEDFFVVDMDSLLCPVFGFGTGVKYYQVTF
jgi:hypothetical protein